MTYWLRLYGNGYRLRCRLSRLPLDGITESIMQLLLERANL